jgi:hypothetical protein
MKAYVDEFGNSDIETDHQGATKYFIISAVIIKDQDDKELKDNLDKISENHFHNGIIKSSYIGNDDNKRLRILADICKLRFMNYSLIVNKELLYGQGFTYKGAFYKFLNGKLHSDLYKAIPDLLVLHDSYGTDKYKESFRQYIKNRHSRDLFSESDFFFIRSNECRQIQLADFICGCYSRIYEPGKINEYEKNYRELLSKINGTIEEWPTEKNEIEIDKLVDESQDNIIERVAIHTIYEYLGRYENVKNDDIRVRVMFLKYLLYSYKYFDKKVFIYTKEIRDHLALNRIYFSNYQLRSSIVAPLRDEGVLIVSSSQGYKVPVCKNDIVKYIQHSKSIIEPMISRLNVMQKILLLGSGGSINIYSNFDFPESAKK